VKEPDPAAPQWNNNATPAFYHQLVEDYSHLCLHKELFSPVFNPELIFQKQFLLLHTLCESGVENCFPILQQELVEKGLISVESPEIYSVDMFQSGFCERLCQEKDNYERSGLPIIRPNSMNNYGLVLGLIGMNDFLQEIVKRYLLPVSKVLFPEESTDFDNYHAFIVTYETAKDVGLDMHVDNSAVTWNICLVDHFEGAGLTFCGNKNAKDARKISLKYNHRLGRAVVHKGNRRHGADDLTVGKRENLIVWCQNSSFEKSSSYQGPLEREEGPPDLQCLSWTWDIDFPEYKEYPPGRNPLETGHNPVYPYKPLRYEGFPSPQRINKLMAEQHQRENG
jgi:hypothetical protein